ncbi:MAG: hypothetical protein ACLPN5_23210 [Roseiarcus sp.]
MDWSQQLEAAHRAAAAAFDSTAKLVAELPRTREAQAKVVAKLTETFRSSHAAFEISKPFLVENVRLRDRHLVDSWTATPNQLAWLMVHEAMSHYFARFALQKWSPDALLIHHVPKTAGTSLNALVHERGYFIAYPQPGFKAMWASHGLLGFPRQVRAFERGARRDRLYIGGHYNLPDRIAELDLFGRVRGVTLCRPPADILSSAARFVWTKIETEGPEFASLYGVEGVDGGELARQRNGLASGEDLGGAAAAILRAIIGSAQFRSEYDEIYVKFFLNGEVDSPARLRQYIQECGALFVSVDPSADTPRTLAALDLQGTLPRANVSRLSERTFVELIGGPDAFAALCRERMGRSEEIFRALVGVHDAAVAAAPL